MNYTTLENAEFSRVLPCMEGFKKLHHLAGAVCRKTMTSLKLHFFCNSHQYTKKYTIFWCTFGVSQKIAHLHIESKYVMGTSLYFQPFMLFRKSKIALANSNMANSDPVEEIRKYKMLADEGIITEEEYQKKKMQLLGL